MKNSADLDALIHVFMDKRESVLVIVKELAVIGCYPASNCWQNANSNWTNGPLDGVQGVHLYWLRRNQVREAGAFSIRESSMSSWTKGFPHPWQPWPVARNQCRRACSQKCVRGVTRSFCFTSLQGVFYVKQIFLQITRFAV